MFQGLKTYIQKLKPMHILALGISVAALIVAAKAYRDKKQAEKAAKAMFGGDASVSLNSTAIMKDFVMSAVAIIAIVSALHYAVKKLGARSPGFSSFSQGGYRF